jgi:hypothetical protein
MFLTVRDRHSKTHPWSTSQAVQSTQTEGQGLDAQLSRNEPTDFIRHSFHFFQLKPKPMSYPERSDPPGQGALPPPLLRGEGTGGVNRAATNLPFRQSLWAWRLA